MKNVLAEITRLRLERGWNEYELAKTLWAIAVNNINVVQKKSDTYNTKLWIKVCKGLGISLSLVFAGGE